MLTRCWPSMQTGACRQPDFTGSILAALLGCPAMHGDRNRNEVPCTSCWGPVACLQLHTVLGLNMDAPGSLLSCGCCSRLAVGHLPHAVARQLAPLVRSQQIVLEALIIEEPLGEKEPLLVQVQVRARRCGLFARPSWQNAFFY